MLWEEKQQDLSVKTLSKGETYLLDASILLTQLKDANSLPVVIADKIFLASNKHEEVINELIKIQESQIQKEGLNNALIINHQAKQQILKVK